jgi:hypothetical protein
MANECSDKRERERLAQCIESVEHRLEAVRTGIRREDIFREEMNMPNVVVERAEALVKSAQLLLSVAQDRAKKGAKR